MSTLGNTFVEFEIFLFPAKDFNKYIKGTLGEEDEDEIEKLMRQSSGEEVELPVHIKGTVGFRPEDVFIYTESFSLMESHFNPDSPKLDSVEVTLRSGEQYLLNCTLQEFKDKMAPFFTQKTKLPKASSISPK